MGRKKLTTDEFIKKAREIHGDKYDYSKVEYKKAIEKVCILCPEHGEFWQKPSDHLTGYGCIKCGIKKSSEKRLVGKDNFLERAKLIHGDKYDYSFSEYNGMEEKIKIICHKKYRNGGEHGEFWQTPHNHLKGNGCPICRNSFLEELVKCILNDEKINYIEKVNNKFFLWLDKQHLDFYLPDYNIAIECQGEQHFTNFRFEKNNDGLNKRLERDKIKYKLCKDNGVKLIYFSNLEKYDLFLNEKIVKTKEDLINKIYG